MDPRIKKAFAGRFIPNGRFTVERANQAIADGRADAVAFGELVISNPDLAARITRGAALAPLLGKSTHYHFGLEGYVDFPALATR